MQNALILLLFANPKVDNIQVHKVVAGQTLSFAIKTMNTDDNFMVSFDNTDLPDGSNIIDNGDNTATFVYTPSWNFFSLKKRDNSDQIEQQMKGTAHLTDDGKRYGSTDFVIMVVLPKVDNATNVLYAGGKITINGINFGNDESVISVRVGNYNCTSG